MLVINSRLTIPREEFEFSYARSGGPGGQNVNKVNTKVTLRWPVESSPSLPPGIKERFLKQYARRITINGELVLSSQRYRDQIRNQSDCLEKLRQMVLEVAEPPKLRRPTRASRCLTRAETARQEATVAIQATATPSVGRRLSRKNVTTARFRPRRVSLLYY